MPRIPQKNRANGYRTVFSPIAFAILLILGTLNAAPIFRPGVEINLANQNFVDVTNLEFNGAIFTEVSRDYRCPYRISGGIRVASFTYGDLGYLIVAPEVNANYIMSITNKIGLMGGIGAGYFISNANEVESGAYARLSAGIVVSPLPVLDLRISASTIPFKTPSGEKFMNYGVGAGISYMFGFPDTDGDWVANDIDTCPGTPPGAKVDRWGCALDSDGDGVYDGLDKCPNTPFGALVDSCGCPLDSDGDGVYDGIDQCPGTPSHIAVDSTGCPRDSDRDGVPDYLDKCPDTPIGAIVDANGCPKDSDEDGVYDGIDKCPNTPSGFIVDEFGCPFVKPVEREVISDAYDNGLNLKAPAVQKLEDIAERLRAHPYRKVEVGVHTDSEGSDQYNINRSLRVGEKVKELLVARGVPSEIMILKGYGEAHPLVSNASAEGVMRNRRIVFQYMPSN